jgi:hypothetical protein
MGAALMAIVLCAWLWLTVQLILRLLHVNDALAASRLQEARLWCAIRDHRDQRADDRCWMDDQDLYAVLGDGNLGDNRVGDPAAMIENCARFITKRCEGGHWPTYAELEAQIARQHYALRTRPDYDFRCQRCGAPHNLDTSIPSPIWNVIVERESPGGDKYGALCTICIDDLMAEKGLSGEAEFYFVGRALRSRTYPPRTEL